MTIIECFERDPLDNIATCLSLRADTLVFIGEKEEIDANIEKYRHFFGKRRPLVKILTQTVKYDDINEVIKTLIDIIKSGDECVVDLSGGDEVVVAAAGAVYAQYKNEYPITLQRINAKTGDAEDCDGDGEAMMLLDPTITIDELIKLYGGIAVPEALPDDEITVDSIRPIWNAVTRDPLLWNRKVGALNDFEKHSGATKTNIHVTINFNQLKNTFAKYEEKLELLNNLIDDLDEFDIIKIHSRNDGELRYTYRTPFFRRCLRKAGNALELKTLLEAKGLNKSGQPLFNDCLIGVTIDWDGVLHKSIPGGIKDTRNEIDVMLTSGLTPIFISCKNGDIEEEELYKLNTVAERFGGERAKKVLIATKFLPDNEDSKRSLLQRAKDMNIYLEPDAASLTSDEWHNLFFNIIEQK